MTAIPDVLRASGRWTPDGPVGRAPSEVRPDHRRPDPTNGEIPIELTQRLVRMIAEGPTASPVGAAHGSTPAELDWEAFRRVAATSPSPQRAIGRTVLLAWDAAVLERRGEVIPDVLTLPDPRTPVPAPAPTPAVEPPEARVADEVQPRRRRTKERRRHFWIDAFTWIRNIGAILLLFVAWQLWGTAIGEHHAQDQLRNQFEAKVHSGILPPGVAPQAGPKSPVTLIPASEQFQNPADGSVVAQLTVPKIGLNQYVVSGTTADDLAKGPGHYVGTALPGQAGNVAIAGHRTTHGAPFNRLADLSPGDTILLTTTWGERLTYVVSQPPYPVQPSNVSVLNDFGDDRVTLTTCNPEFQATQRLIVVALLKQKVTGGSAGGPHTYRLAHVVSPGWQMGEFVPFLFIMATLVALGFLSKHMAPRLGRRRWIALAPIWIVGLYVLFQVLTSFLPPSV